MAIGIAVLAASLLRGNTGPQAAEPPPAAVDASLRGRVLDSQTGSLTPCSVTILDARGRVVTERESFTAGFRCPGEFEKQLPPGRTRVRITRGFETRAIEREVELLAGEVHRLEFKLERVVDLRQRGWFAGDSHAHMLHGERTVPVDFDSVALAARAEDLQYLSLAQAWTLEDPTPERLAAELSRRSTPDCVLTWNLEAPKNYYRGDAGRCLGHCWFVGMQGRTGSGQDVIPLLTAASAADYESDKPSFANFESHALIHAQGGAVFYSHPLRWWMGGWGGQGGYPRQENMRVSNLAVELPLDTLIGPTYDGLDVMTSGGETAANAAAFELWSLLLNHGYRLAATASSDACFDRPGGAVPGAARTYTFLDEPFSLPAVARATAAGKTFATTGPLLLASVDGRPPGAVFSADSAPRALKVEAWASGHATGGLTRVELLRNGRPIQTATFTPPVPFWQTNFAVLEKETAWYCVRTYGQDPQQRQRASTGAFFFDGPDHRPPTPVKAQVQARIVDAGTGQPLAGTLTEVAFHGPLPREGQRHAFEAGEASLSIPGTVRLRAEVPGYLPLTLSPFFDHPPLIEAITRLDAGELLDWKTYERIRGLLAHVSLSFKLQPEKR